MCGFEGDFAGGFGGIAALASATGSTPDQGGAPAWEIWSSRRSTGLPDLYSLEIRYYLLAPIFMARMWVASLTQDSNRQKSTAHRIVPAGPPAARAYRLLTGGPESTPNAQTAPISYTRRTA